MTRLPDASRRRTLARLAASSLATLVPLAHAKTDSYPTRPIMLVMPFPAGGATDSQMRALALAAGKELGQTIVVMNQPGAAGTLGPASMARQAHADGYTVSIVPATLFRMPHLQKVTFNPTTDFSYILNLTGYTNGIVVRADAPWKTLPELLADAKARPGKISYGSTGIGSGGHIAMERLLRAAGGPELNFVPFKGMAEETAALLGGHLDVISDPGWGPLVEGGKARVLATLGEQRLKRWGQVPTLKELGYDITVVSPVGLAGPKGMDPAIVQRLHDAFKNAMADATYQRILEQSDQPNVYMGSAEYQQYAVAQFAREKQFIDQLGIKLQ
ncbi:tripartite tricarboxylate transporter substrate binding protein [Pseudorhodoferax sp.]|uniref:tripartite tricarboxylate transporter substrate binding protein n=1 Tax=Pseudorhodoferax sp. TaxID=1993553 RepID=UPI002DD62B4F|nr:tripartite tricarboxylate transporter substrate binding protein [Pseudorhodoferax sp.]